MYRLSDQQVDFISRDISTRGIGLASLQEDLLDHICILLETCLEPEDDFYTKYQTVIKTFYKNELAEIEAQTLFLLQRKGPQVLLSRMQFFGLLFTVLIGPFIAYLIGWYISPDPLIQLPAGLRIWEIVLVYALFPLLILMVLFLTPQNLDPLIPKKSRILLGIHPFIQILPWAG